jgi:hypothetical protein
MRHSKLSTLNDDDFDALYDAVLRAPLAIARLAASLPRERFPFALGALADTGLLHLDVREDRIVLRAPYAPRSGPVVVKRAARPEEARVFERRRRPMPVERERRSTLIEDHEELELNYLADELGIDEQTLKNQRGAQAGHGERRAHRRR